MDLIKLYSTSAYATELTEAVSVEGYTSALWVERYQEPGEFKIKAPLSSGLKTLLPIGSFISHVKTRELMRVEHHIIKEPKAKDPVIEISGRSFVSFLEERIVAQNHVAGGGDDIYVYQIDPAPSWEQIEYLIFDHLVDAITVDFEDSLPGVYVDHSCSGTVVEELRTVKYGTIWERVAEYLKIDDLGIRMERPTPTQPDTYFMIYQGTDRTADVRFSATVGDLENIEYLFSHKRIKNYIRVVGRWVQVVTNIGSPQNINRRYMMIDASDYDNQWTEMPTGGALSLIQAAMVIRGQEQLKKQKSLIITQADVSPYARLRYGIDYFLGDLVMVDGNFNESQIMRVTEFAETEDENGTSGAPTLEVPGDNDA